MQGTDMVLSTWSGLAVEGETVTLTLMEHHAETLLAIRLDGPFSGFRDIEVVLNVASIGDFVNYDEPSEDADDQESLSYALFDISRLCP